MPGPCAPVLLLAPVALEAMAAGAGDYSVRLCSAPPAERPAFLQVRLGPLRAGEELVLRSHDGRILGALSPHGIRPGAPGGTYSVPVPATAFAGRALRVLVRISGPRAVLRVPSRREVEAVRLIFGPLPAGVENAPGSTETFRPRFVTGR